MQENKVSSIFTAAIDFGTTYSGYAYSTLNDYKQDPLKIHTEQWIASSNMMYKTSTCVLFTPDKKFHSFGFKAEEKYINLAENNEHHKWYYFRRFKMMLYDNKTISKETELKEEQGKTMTAITVFAAAIQYLTNHLQKHCEDRILGITDDDIRWVITVPAIWSDKAKSFMREAASLAGIKDQQLILTLEPEAAAVYCKHLPVVKTADAVSPFSPGSRYLVVDAGGGTIDITAHEITSTGKMKEICKVNGGDWGGTKVDEAFKEFLEDIIGKKAMDIFEKKQTEDKLYLDRDFEMLKRKVSGSDESVNIRIPCSISDVYKDLHRRKTLKDAIKNHREYKSSVIYKGDKLRCDANIIRDLFNNSIERVTSHIENLISGKMVTNLQFIIMVGGFSESPLLQEAIKRKFGDTLTVIIPDDAGLAVMKGAVLFGHNPSLICSRICKFTYGISHSSLFIDGVHPEKYKFQSSDGKYYCKNIFSKFIDEGTEVRVGQLSDSKELFPMEADQIRMTTTVVASKNKNSKYITDEECNILGTLSIDMPDTSKGLDRAVIYTINFGETELKISAKDRDNGNEMEAKFMFI